MNKKIPQKTRPMFEPRSNFIVAKPFTQKETDAIELLKTSVKLPEMKEKKGRTIWATVIAVGPGKDGWMGYDVGDVILLSEYDSYEIRVRGELFVTVREEFVFTTFNR